jgi:hypothetical protein
MQILDEEDEYSDYGSTNLSPKGKRSITPRRGNTEQSDCESPVPQKNPRAVEKRTSVEDIVRRRMKKKTRLAQVSSHDQSEAEDQPKRISEKRSSLPEPPQL